MPDETPDEPLQLPLGDPEQPPAEPRPPREPAPPLALLIAAGIILALLLAVILDVQALGRAREAVNAAHLRVQAAEAQLAVKQQELATLKAAPPVHNGCSDLA